MRASLSGRPLAALLLDLDDTILDDRAGFEEAWRLAAGMLRARHVDLEDAAIRAEVERARSHFWADAERHRRGRLDLPAARAEILAAALERLGRPDPELAREAGWAWTALRERHQRFLPGAQAALRRLRGLVPAMALVTNGAADAQRAKLRRFALEPLFDHVQIEGEFGLGKPEPRVFRHVVARLGVHPDACLTVGDNLEADVRGAQAVGIRAAWLDRKAGGGPPVLDRAQPRRPRRAPRRSGARPVGWMIPRGDGIVPAHPLEPPLPARHARTECPGAFSSTPRTACSWPLR